jgi:hypothetical protein
MSAITNADLPFTTVPSSGSSVVNGYPAILGFAPEQAESSEDFPALGSPIIPTSAISFNSSF